MTRRRSSRAPGAIHIEDPFFLSIQVSNHIIDDPTKHMGRGVSSSPGGNERVEGRGNPVWSNIHPIVLGIIFKTDTRSGDASSSEEPYKSPLVMRDHHLNYYYLRVWKELFTNGL